MYIAIPLKPSPVTRNTEPASGNFSFSSSDIPYLPHVTNISSRFGPPQQHEVVLRAGKLTVCNSWPMQTIKKYVILMHVSRPNTIKLCSGSTQMSIKFLLLITIKILKKIKDFICFKTLSYCIYFADKC